MGRRDGGGEGDGWSRCGRGYFKCENFYLDRNKMQQSGSIQSNIHTSGHTPDSQLLVELFQVVFPDFHKPTKVLDLGLGLCLQILEPVDPSKINYV